MLLLEQIMDREGISGKDLAEKAGVTAATISNIRKGISYPKYDLLVKIANSLNVDVRELFPSTKNQISEDLYVKRNGEFIHIGSLKVDAK